MVGGKTGRPVKLINYKTEVNEFEYMGMTKNAVKTNH